MTLIEELYSSNAVDLIRDLYKDDPSAKESFYEAFGNKILQSSEKVLLSKPLDILMLICSTAKFASSKDECSQVAVIVYKRIKEPNYSSLLPKLGKIEWHTIERKLRCRKRIELR